MKIQSLEKTPFPVLYNAFSKAFGEYEVQINSQELFNMLERRGYNPLLSFGAFKNQELVSFILNGTDYYNNQYTAYDTGTGTIPEYRGQNLSSKIFEYATPYLQKAGITHYLLEVLQHNSSAIKIYKNIGFTVQQEYHYYVYQKCDIHIDTKQSNYTLQHPSIQEIVDYQIKNPLKVSWQNSSKAILRNPTHFKTLGCYDNNILIAYCICEPQTGDITQLYVHPKFRFQGIASYLLKKAIEYSELDSFKIINVNIQNLAFISLLNKFNIFPNGQQYEMQKIFL